MKKQITIRDFESKDMNNVVALLQSVSIFEPEVSKMKYLASKFIKNCDCYACVAEHDGLVVGIGTIFLYERIRGGLVAIIEDIAIHENERGSGIGKMVVEKLLDYAKTNNCFKVTLVCSDENIGFYMKIGFKEDYKSMKIIF